MADVSDDPLEHARAERLRLIDRITWWDSHRYTALVPIALACFGGGYGAGYLVRSLLGAPERTELICALATLFGVGRLVDRYFSTTHLDLVDVRIARLERERATKRRGP